jgi:hypothetical protein
MYTKPFKPVGVQQDERRGDADTIEDTEQRDGKGRKKTYPRPLGPCADSFEVLGLNVIVIKGEWLGNRYARLIRSRLDIRLVFHQ